MSILTDDFSSDTSANWAHSGGSAGYPTSDMVWNLTDFEAELTWNAENALIRYTSKPNSLDHEVQATIRCAGTTLEHCATASPRMDGGDGYWLAVAADYRASLARYNAGSITALRYIDLTDGTDYATGAAAAEPDTSDWVTVRIAAEGAAGANVTISMWWTIHGASKPGSDPGWIGVDGSPQFTWTDSDASRLDDATHDDVGIAGLQNASDTRLDYWKARAISDRSAGVSLSWLGQSSAAVSPAVRFVPI